MALLYLNVIPEFIQKNNTKDRSVPSTPSSPILNQHLIPSTNQITKVSDVASLIVHTLWYNIPLITLIHDTHQHSTNLIKDTSIQHSNTNTSTNSKAHNYNAFNAHCKRFLILTGLSAQVVQAGLFYIHKLKKIILQTGLVLKYINTDLLLWSTTLLIAHKYLDDKTYTNATFGKLNGVDGIILNQCEIELLGIFEYGIGIDENVFEKFGESLGKMVGDAVVCLDVSRKMNQRKQKRFIPY